MHLSNAGEAAMPTRKICPRCKSSDTARSHRRLYERLIPGLAAFRCDECKLRFLIFRGATSGLRQS
jgi:transposase-like protein